MKSQTKWIRGDLLGKGGFARVYFMQDAVTGEFYAGKFSGADLPKPGTVSDDAPKILKDLQKARKMLKEEIAIHKTVKHPGIVRYISSFSTDSCYEERDIIVSPDKNGKCEVLVLERYPNKNLHDLLKARKRVSEDEARFFMFHLAQALKYLKDSTIMHRDVKLGNIFLDADMYPKLGDFGLALNQEGTVGIAGTPNYMAPEVARGSRYSFPVDTWALGVCLYALIIGKHPFEARDLPTTYKRLGEAIYDFPAGNKISNFAKDLIKRIFVINTGDRILIEDVLKHPFFTEEPMIKSLPIIARIEEPKKKEITMVPTLVMSRKKDATMAASSGWNITSERRSIPVDSEIVPTLVMSPRKENTELIPTLVMPREPLRHPRLRHKHEEHSSRMKSLKPLKKMWEKSGYLPLDKFYLYIAKQTDKPDSYIEFTKKFEAIKL